MGARVAWLACCLLHPPWTGIMTTQMLHSPQLHHDDTPLLRKNPNSHILMRNPPQCHLLLIRNNG